MLTLIMLAQNRERRLDFHQQMILSRQMKLNRIPMKIAKMSKLKILSLWIEGL